MAGALDYLWPGTSGMDPAILLALLALGAGRWCEAGVILYDHRPNPVAFDAIQ